MVGPEIIIGNAVTANLVGKGFEHAANEDPNRKQQGIQVLELSLLEKAGYRSPSEATRVNKEVCENGAFAAPVQRVFSKAVDGGSVLSIVA